MVEKATLESETGTSITFGFNPDQLVISKANAWFAGPRSGRTAPSMQFVGGRPGSIRLQLVFDSTDTGEPVTRKAALLESMMKVEESLASFDQSTNNQCINQLKIFNWRYE